MDTDLDYLLSNHEHLDRESNEGLNDQERLTFAGNQALVNELQERKEQLFNKRKLVNVIIHRKQGQGLPQNIEVINWPKLPKHAVLITEGDEKDESKQVTLPNIPMRQIIWKVLSCHDGIVKSCLENYNK